MRLVLWFNLACLVIASLIQTPAVQAQTRVLGSLTLEEKADQGDADAQNLLGLRALAAKTPNYTNAFRWFRLAAEKNLPIAAHNLGGLYFRGSGIPQNFKEALKWYQKAAEAGFAPSQSFLGWMYANGKGVEESDVEALKWYRKAAEQGDKEAQFRLGLLHLDGEPDYVEAYKWINLSAAQGNTNAIRFRFRLTASMTAEQIAEGQRRASDFATPQKPAAPPPEEPPAKEP